MAWDTQTEYSGTETEDEEFSAADSEETTMNKQAISYMKKVDELISLIADLEK